VKILPVDIDRRDWSTLGPKAFREEYLLPLRPVAISGAINHWGAMGKWTPEFFRKNYETHSVTVDGKPWQLGELLQRIEFSTPENPAPYLRNELLARWPAELRADVAPMPACTQPNWLESKAFPSRSPPTYTELYIGGGGAKFPVLHYDNLHTHAFLMQLYGEKEYFALAPDQAPYVYPQDGEASNKSRIVDIEHEDPERFPLFSQASGIRFKLRPGETLFVPAGWWHTARILTTSITVSINGANAPNWGAFIRDYCADIKAYSRWKAAVLLPYLALLGDVLSIGQ
jgi:histone arginine demethylase JMJD6